jgi:hypothetical protein
MLRDFRAAWTVLALVALTACAPKGPQPKTLELNGFERVPDAALLKRQFDPAEAIKKPTYPDHDYDVATSGYAALSAFNKEAARAAGDKPLYKFIQGKTAARIRFTVPQDYKTPGTDAFPKVWETGFGLSIDSKTPLKATDWSAYKYLSLRVYNPGPLQQELRLRISDASSTVTQTAALVPLGETELEFPLELLTAARLNPRDIKSLTFYLDSAGQAVDPVLYVDALALQDMDAALRAKIAAEEGEEEADDEDWDEEDSDVVRQVRVLRPGQAVEAPKAVEGPAAAE